MTVKLCANHGQHDFVPATHRIVRKNHYIPGGDYVEHYCAEHAEYIARALRAENVEHVVEELPKENAQ